MYNTLFWLRPLFVACFAGLTAAHAADIRVDTSHAPAAGAVLEGTIEAGDFDKFKDFILKGNNAVELYLASPGGNLAEAMKIGILVRLLKLSTVVPSKGLTNESVTLAAARHHLKDPKANYTCASACFFIFVAGVHRSYDGLGPAILGIHRPAVLENDLKRMDRDQAAAADKHIQTAVEKYLKAMDVPEQYANSMYNLYASPKGRVRWIRSDEFDADFDGFIPKLKDWVNAVCDNLTDIEQKNWERLKYKARAAEMTAIHSAADASIKRYEARLDCETKLQDGLALEAYRTLRTSESPLR